MKVLLATLNAKYIHTSLALRLLYVVNNDKADVDFKEYIIKENVDFIAEDILSEEYDIVCLGVYIWNVSQTGKNGKIQSIGGLLAFTTLVSDFFATFQRRRVAPINVCAG